MKQEKDLIEMILVTTSVISMVMAIIWIFIR